MERFAACISVLVAVLIVVAAVLGPLGLGIVRFHMHRSAIVQYQGSEVVMLLVAVGMLIGARLWWQERLIAPTLTTGLALFVIYTFVTVVMPQEYALYPDGNAERAMLLYFGITALASVLVVLGINALVGIRVAVSDRWHMATQWVLGVQAGVFLILWLAQIAGVYRNGMTEEIEQTRGLFWLVKYLDLGIVIPIAFLTIMVLRRDQPLGPVLVVATVGFVTVMLVAIAAMSVSSWWQDETGGSVVLAIGMVVFAVPSAVVWWQWARAIDAKHW